MIDFLKKQTPLAICTFFTVLVTICFFANVSSGILAGLLLLSFTGFSLLNPKNGFYMLVFAVPFFLGNSKREFYFLLEYFALITLITSVIDIYRCKRQEFLSIKCNYIYIGLLFFTGCLFLAIPVNLKEFYYDIRGSLGIDPVSYLKTQALLFSYGHEGKHIYWLRTLFNHLLSISIFMVVPFILTKEDIKKLISCAVFSLLIVLVGGYLFYYDVVPHQGLYFSFSLVGRQHGIGMTAFAYNRGYLSQYLILFIPFVFYYIEKYRKNVKGLFFWCLFFLALMAVVLTTQRTALVVFMVQLFCLPFYYFLSAVKITKKSLLVTLFFVIATIAVFLLVDMVFLNSMLKERLISLFSSLGQRSYIWRGAFVMWKNNILLGVGLGRYHHFFPYYFNARGSQLMLERTTAHNLYLHLLAQQGILTFSAFLFFIGALFIYSLKIFRQITGESRIITAVLLLSTIGFLGYGIGQYMFYVRSIALSFWIIAGCLYLMIKDNIKGINFSVYAKGCMLIAFFLLLLYRLYTVAVWSL